MKMSKNTEKGKTPLEQRQARIQHLREISKANQDKTAIQLEKLFTDYLLNEGLSYRKIREYLDLISSIVVT